MDTNRYDIVTSLQDETAFIQYVHASHIRAVRLNTYHIFVFVQHDALESGGTDARRMYVVSRNVRHASEAEL